MIIELGAWAGTAVLLHQAIFADVSDKKKIQKTFENVKFGFADKQPMHSWTKKYPGSTVYAYNLPYGLMDNPKLELILEKTLNKPVKIETDSQMRIKVYKERLKPKYTYRFHETKGWTAPIGHTLDKLILHDFDKIPHMTIAGMTRQGKTVLLKLIFAHLIHNRPDDVEFYIIDLKGGLEFGRYENLKQVKMIASNVHEAQACLQEIQKQIKEDMSDFKAKGHTNILETKNNRRRFIIVDEGAELTPSKHHTKSEKWKFDYCQHALSEICRVAGALGYRNIFCTQYPTADTLPRQIKQNSDAKISFRLPTEIASRVAIDEQGAESITNVGRAIYRTHEKSIVQVPYIDDENIMNELGVYQREPDTKESQAPRRDIIEFG